MSRDITGKEIDMKIGTKIKILNMSGEPDYAGKEGVVTRINPAYEPAGIVEQWHGTWGGCAVQPDYDDYEIIKEEAK